LISRTDDKQADLEWFLNENPELAEAREAGVDVWALWANLQRSPEERLRRHQIAMDLMRKLRKVKKIEKK
jgi:hypothetical protein